MSLEQANGSDSAPSVVQQTTIINTARPKSVPGAIILAFLFGPIGMIYSTWVGATVMFFVNVVVIFVTFGLGLIITIPIGMVWAGIATSSHNRELGSGFIASQSVAAAQSGQGTAASEEVRHGLPTGAEEKQTLN